MKAITIKNPWAYLIAQGIKDIENRTWKTNYRGKILIHAGQKNAHYRGMELLFTPEQWAAMGTQRNIAAAGFFPSSAIIGEVEIVDCVQNSASVWAIPGQWHWVLKNAKMFKGPILNVKGKLSFWEYAPYCDFCKCKNRSTYYRDKEENNLCNDCDLLITAC